MSDKRKKIAVVGVGNILLSDEGIGVRAVELLKERGVPEEVDLFDVGTSLDMVLSQLEGFDKMVILDAVKAGGEPGRIYRFSLKELEQGKKENSGFMLSLHELDIPRLLELERLVFKLPEEIVFIGMEPASLSPGMELSEAINKRMNEFIKVIEQELGDKKGG